MNREIFIKRKYISVFFSVMLMLLIGICLSDTVSAGNIHVWVCKGAAYGWKDNEQYYYGDEVFLNYEFTGAGSANYDLQLKYCDPDGNWQQTSKQNKLAKAHIHWVCNKLGTYKGEAVITGETYGDVGVDFNVQRVPISKCEVSIWNPTYTGDAVKPRPSVKYTPSGGSEIILKEGTDYSVTYSNNVKAGTGYVTITGKGNYTGTITKSFSIVNRIAIVYKDNGRYYDAVDLGTADYKKICEDKKLFIRFPLDSELVEDSKIDLYQSNGDSVIYFGSALCQSTGYYYNECCGYYPLSSVYPTWLNWRGKQRIAFQIVLANGQIIWPVSTSEDKNFLINIIGQYNVYYNPNGGTGTPAAQNKYKNVSIVLNDQVPEREGYTFEGWSTSPDGDTSNYLPGDEYSENSDLHLYAIWKKKKQVVDLIKEPKKDVVQPIVNNNWGEISEKGKSDSLSVKDISTGVKITTHAKVSAVKKLKKKYTIKYRGKLKLKIKTKNKLSFKTKNKKIVSVSKNGKIVGKRYGSAKVIVTEQNKGKAISKAIKINVVPKTPKIKSLYRKNYFHVLFLKKKDSSVTGNQICVAQSKKFKKGKRFVMSLVNKEFKESKTNIQMPSKGKYYVKIRAYKRIGKKTYYGAWSNIKLVK